MTKNDNLLEIDGVVEEVYPNALFKVRLKNDTCIKCKLSGKIRMHYIRILAGDRVKVSISPYDLTIGRIVFRYK